MKSLNFSIIFIRALLVVAPAVGFSPVSHTSSYRRTSPSLTQSTTTTTTVRPLSWSPLFQSDRKQDNIVSEIEHHQQQQCSICSSSSSSNSKRQKLTTLWNRLQSRLDTRESANLRDAQLAGSAGGGGGGDSSSSSDSSGGLFGQLKKAHNPVTYLVLSALVGFKFDKLLRNPFYWFAVGFCIKWYRARYVFKIPVWDRQPNWNNVITNKEQEKDLKAYTCKKCGSTIFIAKTREFFFEGATGIGGLGCFTCGAKGKENFVMDRDRIVEDVGDLDDYFDYERPLDFVSSAERRKILKEAEGDEERANQLLIERANAVAGITDTITTATTTTEESTETESTSSSSNNGDNIMDAETEPSGDDDDDNDDDDANGGEEPKAEIADISDEKVDEKTEDATSSSEPAAEKKEIVEEKPPAAKVEKVQEEKPKKPVKKPEPKKPEPKESSLDDDLDVLGLDDF